MSLTNARPGWQIPFGAPRLAGGRPQSVRSAFVVEDGAPLRLSSGVVDIASTVPAAPTTDDQFAALEARLLGLSDPWSRSARSFVEAYLAFVADEIVRSEDAIAELLAVHDGLYTPADVRFAAWLPLPQAHVPGTGGAVRFPFVFWSGREVVAVEIGQGRGQADLAKLLPAVRLVAIDAGALAREPVATLRSVLPQPAVRFWEGVKVPTAPLRTDEATLAL